MLTRLLVGLMLLSLLATAGCSLRDVDFAYDANKVRPNTQNLPLYPNARQITHEDRNMGEGVPEVHTTFTTPDSSQAVLAFYQTVLTKDGWEPAGITPPPNALYFGWSNGLKLPGYSLVVTVAPSGSHTTRVELTLRTYFPE